MNTSPYNAYPMQTGAFLNPAQQRNAYFLAKRVYEDRKSHKRCRSTKEQVWPEHLEVALIEGLMTFKPNLRARETRHLGRFPFRNKHISEYISRKTGEHRDAKQVGSRLQQLGEYVKETTDDHVRKQLEELLAADSFSSPSSSRSPSRSPPSSVFSLPSSCRSPPSSPPSSPSMSASSFDADDIHWIEILPSDSLRSPSTTALPIQMIEPLVCFTSQAFLTNGIHSHCEVVDVDTEHVLGQTVDAVVYAGYTYVEQKKCGRYRYDASLASTYWNAIVVSPDPTRFAIRQVLTDNNGLVLCEALHRFRYPVSSPPRIEGLPGDMYQLPIDWDSQQIPSISQRSSYKDAFTFQPLLR